MTKVLAAALAFPLFALAADQAWPPPKGPAEVELKVGEVYPICRSKEVICPVGSASCDDPKVAARVDTPDGIAWKAVGKGTTACYAVSTSGTGFRRAFRVTVTEAK